MNLKIVVLLSCFLCIFISGCVTDCTTGNDNKINVSVIENRDIQENMGFSNRHVIILNITNIADTTAKSVIIYSAYCNELRLGQRTCENRTLNIGNIPPKATITKSFEYNRVLIQNQLDGNYHLEYSATSCLPYTTVDNNVLVSQR